MSEKDLLIVEFGTFILYDLPSLLKSFDPYF